MPRGKISQPQSPFEDLPPLKRAKVSSKPLLAQEPKAVLQKLELPPSPFAEAARSPTQGMRSPSRGFQSPIPGPQSPTQRPQMPQRGVQSPTRGLQSSPRGFPSPHRGFQSPHRGIQSPTRAPQSPTRGPQSPVRNPKSPEGGSQKLPGPFSNPSSLIHDLPQSPARPSSPNPAELVKDKTLMQGDAALTAASKVSIPAREESQTQAASDRHTPLKRKRLVKAGELVKKRAADESAAAVSASTEAHPLVRSATVGGLALVPLPPKLQEKVWTEEELDEDAPYWQEPLGLRSSGQFGTASSGHFISGPTLSNAAKLLRAGQFVPSHPRAVGNSPEHPFSAPGHVSSPDSSPSQTAAADTVPQPQSSCDMSTSSLPVIPSEPNQDLRVSGQGALHLSGTEQASAQRQQEQQQQQPSWGLHEHLRPQPSESTQKAWLHPLPRSDPRILQSQGSFTDPEDGPRKPPQDPRKPPTNASLAPQGSHLQNPEGSSDQPPTDPDTDLQQPRDGQSQAQRHWPGHTSEQPHHAQGHVQEQPCYQQGSSRLQSQQLQGRSRQESRHRSHFQTSQAPLETPAEAVCFGVKSHLPVAVEPVKMRMTIGYRWGKGSHVQGSLDLQALCWSTDTVGKTWAAAGKPYLHHRYNLHNCINIRSPQ